MDNTTEVVFENIEQRIIQEIEAAHYAIFVSVAWFTNKRLFNALLEKAKSNCYVSIIVQLDDINSQSGINYDEIKIGRSECFFISKDAELIHDKFCVIDFKKVITGSYNWTYKASQNSENVIILSDPSVAAQYITRFEQQKAKFEVGSTKRLTSQMDSDTSVASIDFTPLQAANATPPVVVLSPTILKCSYCQREVQPTDTYCKYCGAQQKESKEESFLLRKCLWCGHEQPKPLLDQTTKFCSKCGHGYSSFNSSAFITLCPQCGTKVDGGVYCSTCGLKREVSAGTVKTKYKDLSNVQYCSHCHAPNYFEDNFCQRCGKDITLGAEDSCGHGWVDLGLSVLWSRETMNGYYHFMDDRRKIRIGDYEEYKPNGKDAATVYWGPKWRTPTKEEFEELVAKCVWEKVVLPVSNKNALKVTGPNGKHIILPVTGDNHRVQNFASYPIPGEVRREIVHLSRGINSENKFNICCFWTSTPSFKHKGLAYMFRYCGYVPDYLDLTEKEALETVLEKHFKYSPSSYYKELIDWQTQNPNSGLTMPIVDDTVLNAMDIIFQKQKTEIETKLKSIEELLKAGQQQKITEQEMRNELWLATPMVRFDYIWDMPIDDDDRYVYSIRPVADKKWKGKL